MNDMRIIILILILTGIVSCNQLENQNKSIHFPYGSKWTFIKNDSKFKENYAEIEFNKNSTLLIHSEFDGQVGPFQYKESDNELTFNNVSYSIISDKNGLIILRNPNEEFFLYKIPCDERNSKSDQIDPFYLRRCYFLVNFNYITTDDAIKYLSNIITSSPDSIPKEEVILSDPR